MRRESSSRASSVVYTSYQKHASLSEAYIELETWLDLFDFFCFETYFVGAGFQRTSKYSFID